MIYALNLADDGRILSSCIVLGWRDGDDTPEAYNGMPVVGTLPDGDVAEYRYVDGEYIHDPLPTPEPEEQPPTPVERITALEQALSAIEEGIKSV